MGFKFFAVTTANKNNLSLDSKEPVTEKSQERKSLKKRVLGFMHLRRPKALHGTSILPSQHWPRTLV